MNRVIQASLLTTCFACFACAENINNFSSKEAAKSPKPSWLSIRHIEGKGIGYKSGYTTLDIFSGLHNASCFLPFINLRGHIFDNGRWAANAGSGFRYLKSGDASRIYGANLFYDVRRTKDQTFHQIGAGVETFGTRWDFRTNAYLPVGKKQSNYSSWSFDRFKEHHLILEKKATFSMYGVDAEMGVHLLKKSPFHLYAAAGTYYFTKTSGRDAIGGKARIKSDFRKMVAIELSGSYDTLFKGIVQGELSLSIPFGPRKKAKANPTTASASSGETKFFQERMYQNVDRAEIIVLSKLKKHTTAINPLTGLPYFFWFVDNTSHSAGTYESPFSSLADAQTASNPIDVIYVFPGDGTFRNMSSGIILKDDQKFFGSGVSHPLQTAQGLVTIPQQSEQLPSIAIIGATDNFVVEVAQNNEVSGFKINLDIFVPGLFAIGVGKIDPSSFIQGLSVTDNLFVNISGGDGFRGVALINADGNVTVANNTFAIDHTNFSVTDDTGIFFSASGTNAHYVFSNNTFQNLSFGILGSQSNGIEPLTVLSNSVNSNSFNNCDIGVGMTINDTLDGTCDFSGEYQENIFANLTTQFIGNATAFDFLSQGGTTAKWHLSENSMTTASPPRTVVLIEAQNSSTSCVRFLNNSAPNNLFSFEQLDTSTFLLEPLENNIGTLNTTGTITPIPVDGCD
ncbi:MAG: inverse autotransporter beta domain-containing protein [Chlamydiales bacterium]